METELLGSQVSFAVAISYLMEWLKTKSWCPLIAKDAQVLNRLVAILIAFVIAIGIHYEFDAVQGRLVVDGLTLGNISHGLSAWVQQYIFQQIAYKKLVSG